MDRPVAEDAVVLDRVAGMGVVAVRGGYRPAGGQQFADRDQGVAAFPQLGDEFGHAAWPPGSAVGRRGACP